MKSLVILTCFLSLFILKACSSKQPSKFTSDATEQTSSIDGKSIYHRECVLCHGEKGNKGVAGSANLTQSMLTLDERVYVITNGRGIMQPYKNKLTPDEIYAVARYTQELNK